MRRTDFRIRLNRPLRGVAVFDPTAVPPTVAEPPATPPAPAPPDFWATEAGVQLRADRELIETLRDRLLTELDELRRRQDEAEAKRQAEWRQAAVELAVTIAAKLLHQHIDAGAFAVEELVRDMVGQLGGTGPVAVRLHPADLELLHDRLDGAPLLPDTPDAPRLIADPTLARGDCRMEAGDRQLVSQLVGQLAEIRDHLLRSIGHEGT